jgi:hypothetical protein
MFEWLKAGHFFARYAYASAEKPRNRRVSLGCLITYMMNIGGYVRRPKAAAL